ncbi:hypothetical protein IAT40_005558 [Kwoniella sp. CBS 6097]
MSFCGSTTVSSITGETVLIDDPSEYGDDPNQQEPAASVAASTNHSPSLWRSGVPTINQPGLWNGTCTAGSNKRSGPLQSACGSGAETQESAKNGFLSPASAGTGPLI